MRPRVLFVGRTRYRLPLEPGLERKFEALGRHLDVRVLASPAPGGGAEDDPRFVLLPPFRPSALDGAAFYALLAPAAAREIRRFRPAAVIAESPQIGAAVLAARRLAGGPSPAVVIEAHGDWRIATRLYGSPARRLANPVADRLSSLALRKADAVRALSPFTARLVEDVRGMAPDAVFPTYSDLGVFAERSPVALPEQPTALFVGALERYKNVDGLVAAWRVVAEAVAGARLMIVGSGSRLSDVESLRRELPGGVKHEAALSPAEVARRMDASTVLVLPSRFEGLGRVVIESFARGRGVVGGACGGILDLVDDGVEGLLVDPEDVPALVRALVRSLSEPGLAERLGAAAERRYHAWHTTPEEFARRTAALVEAGLAKRRP